MSRRQISIQSKSFATLATIAVVGLYLCLFLLNFLNNNPDVVQAPTSVASSYQHTPPPTPSATMIETSTWKTYSNQKYGFSFMYPPTWKVLAPVKKNGFNVIQVDPGKKFYNINIYISPSQFNAVGGLPFTTETIGGVPALDIQDLLFAIKFDPYYYTFDIGTSLSLKPEFDTLVRSVKFQ
jgi:hypothetical protein